MLDLLDRDATLIGDIRHDLEVFAAAVHPATSPSLDWDEDEEDEEEEDEMFDDEDEFEEDEEFDEEDEDFLDDDEELEEDEEFGEEDELDAATITLCR